MLKVTKNGKNERQTVKTQISNKHVIHSQMSWQYPVYSSLPLSPANAGTFPVLGESKHDVSFRCCKTIIVTGNFETSL